MSYASAQDLIDRFGNAELAQLTDKVNGLVVDNALVAKALADAEVEINGYLAVRYPLPLAVVPDLLRRIACNLVRYRLHTDGAPEQVRQNFEDDRRDLEAIAAGRRSLGLPASTPAVSSAGPLLAAGQPVFGGGGLDGY